MPTSRNLVLSFPLFRFASQSGSQQSAAPNPENSYQINSHGASSQLRGSFDKAQVAGQESQLREHFHL
jgi:hypothetical protein